MVADAAPGGFSYRFVVSPGAAPGQIALDWEGAKTVTATADQLGFDVIADDVTLAIRGLRAYTVDADGPHELAAHHVIRGTRVEFAVSGWTGDTPLVIDPTVTWSRVDGGTKSDTAEAVAVDSAGNTIVVGNTQSTDLRTTTGALDPSFNDVSCSFCGDAFVMKIDAAGALVWSTYLGGSKTDAVKSVAVSPSGAITVVGSTNSADFPTTGFDTTFGGTQDGFVTRLSSSGALTWSRYLGGASTDLARGVAADASGNVVVVGITYSTDFPTLNAYDTTLGAPDAFITKFDASGATVFSTLFGGTPSTFDAGDEDATAVAVDSTGNIFVTGSTSSSSFPLLNAFDSKFGVNGPECMPVEAFVAKFTPTGSLVFSSFHGGDCFRDGGTAIATTPTGDVVFVGNTGSRDLPLLNAFDVKKSGGEAFVAKVSGTGTLLWSSFLGETGDDTATGVAVDPSGNIYVVGETSGPFAIKGAFDTTAVGNEGYVTKISGAGVVLWSSYLGGSGYDRAAGVVADATGVNIVGETAASDFPSVTSTAGGAGDAFLFRLPSRANGAACAGPYECASSQCHDGVCCATACAGPCEACSAARKGSGSDGTCGPIPADTDPKDGCAPGTGTCAAAGVCDGAGKCRPYAKVGTSCGTSTCASGSLSTMKCSGDSPECLMAVTPCAPYACDAGACKTTCTSDTDCAATAYCKAGSCVDKLKRATACAESRECTSGYCADGFCCDAKCDGQCEACDIAGSVGSCKPVTGEPRNTRTKCAGSGVCAGTCDGLNGGACSMPIGKECNMACASFEETLSRCDAKGACVAEPAVGCNGHACDGSARCKTTCATNEDCQPGFSCKETKCVAVLAKCSDDGSTSISDDVRTDCAPYRCDPVSAACQRICRSTSDCATGFDCNSGGACVRPAPPSAAAGDDGGCSIASRASDRAPAIPWIVLVAAAVAGYRRREVR